ncbi:MAG: tripartite tricarboxylate transporter substrate binding protein [Pseudacidovorax sp.]|nr:tripartite tricarboxylate transporter substrate binding protein [Pseudacidovorax sp.]
MSIASLPRFKTLLLCGLLAAPLGPAQAAEEAGGPYRLVIGFPPGGALDGLARALAEELRVSLNETVLVDNRPGASTRISIEYVKNARPDGRTLLLVGTPSLVLFPMTYARLNYDAKKDFVPLAHLATVPNVVSTAPNAPYASMAEYARWIKANPTANGVGMTNLGGVLHFSVLKMSQQLGVKLEPVTYKGGAPLATDIMGGHVPLGTDALASQLELHRGGKLRILGVGGTQRLPWLPDVPTVRESGIDGFDRAVAVYGAFAPAGTPKEVIGRLEAAMTAAMKSRAVADRVERLGMVPTGLPGATLAQSMDEDARYWAPVVKESGFKAAD